MFALESSDGLEFAGTIRYPRIALAADAFAFLVGESGCGKSSYLRLVNGTARPTAGSILIKGADASEIPPLERRRRALLVPQEVFLLDASVRDNFIFYYENRGDPVPGEPAMKAALELCCAGPILLDADCASLSGGERQRVFQAIFLSFPDWELLLLDEPTAALDEAVEHAYFENVRDLCARRGAAALIVSHSHAAVEAFATDVIELAPRIRKGGVR